MRKKKSSDLYTIEEIFPYFFWHRCDLCHEEFKKEIAWKIKFPTISRIICSECAKSETEAKRLALTWGKTGGDKPCVRI